MCRNGSVEDAKRILFQWVAIELFTKQNTFQWPESNIKLNNGFGQIELLPTITHTIDFKKVPDHKAFLDVSY